MHRSGTTRAHPWSHAEEASTLRTLNTFAVDLIAIPSMEDLFWYVAQNVVGRLNFVDCVIYQANEAQTDLRQVAAWGQKNPFGRSIIDPLVIPFGRGITGQVAQTQKAIIIDDLLKDQNYIPDTEPARSEICVPLMFRGRVIGVIDSEHPEPNAFDEADLEVLSTVAAMMGAKLELLSEVQRSDQRYHELVTSHALLSEEITHRKALEAKLFEARKMEAVGRLTGRFAHEFNNLLTVIMGNLEFLDLVTQNEDTAQFLDDAKIAAGRGARLMRDMLVFAQRTRLDPEEIDLNRLVRAFCTAHEAALAKVLDLDLAADLWEIRADRKGLENTLFNLVENAQDAISPDGRLQIRTENITHNLSGNPDLSTELLPGRYVRLSVADSGGGISAERLPQIFDPFFTTKPLGEGTGLGLSFVKGFTQQSGGAVTVKSDVGRGTTFQVYLPAQINSANDLLTKSQ